MKTSKASLLLPFVLSAILLFSCNRTQNSTGTEVRQIKDDIQRVLFVLTSHSELGNTGEETGFYLSEASHPWKELTDNGIEVDFVSIAGGMPPVDGFKLDDPINREFWEDPDVQEALKNTTTPDKIDPGQYKAVHFVGGHGTMWDFPQNETIAQIAASIYESGGFVSAVCHGPAALVNIRLSDGSFLVDGARVTSFTNGEEKAVGLDDVVPFLLQDALEERGADFVASDNWSTNVQVSERLITGQNPQSASSLGEILAKAIKK
jgi:putative intracellular protease/amidase